MERVSMMKYPRSRYLMSKGILQMELRSLKTGRPSGRAPPNHASLLNLGVEVGHRGSQRFQARKESYVAGLKVEGTTWKEMWVASRS